MNARKWKIVREKNGVCLCVCLCVCVCVCVLQRRSQKMQVLSTGQSTRHTTMCDRDRSTLCFARGEGGKKAIVLLSLFKKKSINGDCSTNGRIASFIGSWVDATKFTRVVLFPLLCCIRSCFVVSRAGKKIECVKNGKIERDRDIPLVTNFTRRKKKQDRPIIVL